MASNQLLFALQCMHCNAQFFSQASLRAHTKHGPPKCRQYCIRCGCCRDLFLERERLAFHLNQPGTNRRPAASSPSELLITEACRAATATTHLAITTTTATSTLSRRSAAVSDRRCAILVRHRRSSRPCQCSLELALTRQTGKAGP